MAQEPGGSRMSNVLKAKEDMNKSPEQLENEKREIIASRLVKLNLDNKNKDGLIQEAEKYYEILVKIHSYIYDLTEKQDKQKYDMMELAERARQIEKGKAKTRKSNIVHTGLGGSVFNSIAQNFPNAPGKISLFSRYERVTDRRTFKDRRDLWAIEKESKNVEFVKPKAQLKEAAPVKTKKTRAPKEVPAEEAHEEAPAEEAPAEEAPAEEEPAEEEPAEE